MGETNRQIVLRQRPEGLVRPSDFSIVEAPIPEIADGEALLRVEYLGIDATVRTWLNRGEGYLPPVEIGEVVRCSTIGMVVASKCDKFPVGSPAYGLTGWQQYGIISDDGMASPLEPGADLPALLSVYGATGLTAYVGILDIGEAKPGETVVVSAAAGATGSLAVQIAKIHGCRVIGICGSDEKATWLTNELGIDGAINYKTEHVATRLKELCPARIDVYFDNVGGDILDACLGGLAMGGRVVLCGAISVYNDHGRPPGPRNYINLIARRGAMRGFLSLDCWDRFPEVAAKLRAWVASGELTWKAHFFEGLDSAPEALNAMFTGANTGKIIVRL
ncbi:MAG: NADP-dependent oxidoreductase [Acidimicrobiales bacterium]